VDSISESDIPAFRSAQLFALTRTPKILARPRMTPIAYKDGVIAYDSQITSGNTITYDDYQKCHDVKGIRFFMSGKICDYSALQNTYFAACPPRRVRPD
jgi:hypothetical protein